jgi:hypothetical protein
MEHFPLNDLGVGTTHASSNQSSNNTSETTNTNTNTNTSHINNNNANQPKVVGSKSHLTAHSSPKDYSSSETKSTRLNENVTSLQPHPPSQPQTQTQHSHNATRMEDRRLSHTSASTQTLAHPLPTGAILVDPKDRVIALVKQTHIFIFFNVLNMIAFIYIG